jgi:hypothetical protein
VLFRGNRSEQPVAEAKALDVTATSLFSNPYAQKLSHKGSIAEQQNSTVWNRSTVTTTKTINVSDQ